jgi:hypothetical protein
MAAVDDVAALAEAIGEHRFHFTAFAYGIGLRCA